MGGGGGGEEGEGGEVALIHCNTDQIRCSNLSFKATDLQITSLTAALLCTKLEKAPNSWASAARLQPAALGYRAGAAPQPQPRLRPGTEHLRRLPGPPPRGSPGLPGTLPSLPRSPGAQPAPRGGRKGRGPGAARSQPGTPGTPRRLPQGSAEPRRPGGGLAPAARRHLAVPLSPAKLSGTPGAAATAPGHAEPPAAAAPAPCPPSVSPRCPLRPPSSPTGSGLPPPVPPSWSQHLKQGEIRGAGGCPRGSEACLGLRDPPVPSRVAARQGLGWHGAGGSGADTYFPPAAACPRPPVPTHAAPVPSPRALCTAPRSPAHPHAAASSSGGEQPRLPAQKSRPRQGKGSEEGSGAADNISGDSQALHWSKVKKKGGFRQIVGPRLTGRPLSTPSNRLCFPRRDSPFA